jgi:hypothetical protein
MLHQNVGKIGRKPKGQSVFFFQKSLLKNVRHKVIYKNPNLSGGSGLRRTSHPYPPKPAASVLFIRGFPVVVTAPSGFSPAA